jgi:hypothetical protein
MVQAQPQVRSEQAGEREGDNDSDDMMMAAANAAPKPTVNTSGQVVGSIINITA